MTEISESIFRAYDIRGVYPSDINEESVYTIAQAYVAVMKPLGPVVLGKDVRTHSPQLWEQAAKGIIDGGVDVIDIGTVSTDMMYFTVGKYGYGGGIMITASHNPVEYNGMKMVGAKAKAISSDTGIMDIKDNALKREKVTVEKKGHIIEKDIMDDYVQHCLSFIDPSKVRKLKVVANANSGMAGVVVERLQKVLPLEVEPMFFEPDGTFPSGSPNPFSEELRIKTSKKIAESNVDFGVTWDGDADRCLFFDESGEPIDGYFTTAILGEELLKSHPGETIMHDPRLTWAVQETIEAAGGIPLESKVGSSFIRDRMRAENILFAGENSSHFYFRDNYYSDNGIIPFLLMLQKISIEKRPFGEIVRPYREKYFVSGEINTKVKDPDIVLKNVAKHYSDAKISKIDGVSVEYDDWRFNLRKSNTEPFIRLNLETRKKELLEKKIKEVSAFIL